MIHEYTDGEQSTMTELPETCPHCDATTAEVRAAENTIFCGRCWQEIATLPVEIADTTVRGFAPRQSVRSIVSPWQRGYGVDVYADDVEVNRSSTPDWSYSDK